MDAERSGWYLWGPLLFKKDQEVLLYIKCYGCDAYATIHLHSARWFRRIDARKLLEDQFAWVVLATGQTISSDKYPRGKLVWASPPVVNGEDFAPGPGKIAPAKLLLSKGFKPLKKRGRGGKLVECRVPQLDAVSQAKVVANQPVKPFTDLRTKCLVVQLTTQRTVRILVYKGEGLVVLERKEWRPPAPLGAPVPVWEPVHGQKNEQRKKRYGS